MTFLLAFLLFISFSFIVATLKKDYQDYKKQYSRDRLGRFSVDRIPFISYGDLREEHGLSR